VSAEQNHALRSSIVSPEDLQVMRAGPHPSHFQGCAPAQRWLGRRPASHLHLPETSPRTAVGCMSSHNRAIVLPSADCDTTHFLGVCQPVLGAASLKDRVIRWPGRLAALIE
jgi:hypothetical protein